MTARYVAPRVPLVDPKSGLCTDIWYRFFTGLFETSGGGGSVPASDGFQVAPLQVDDLTAGLGAVSADFNSGGLLPNAIVPDASAQFFDLAPPPSSNGGIFSISFGTTGLTPSSPTQGAVTVSGTLIPPNGGTGLSTYAAGDMIYATGVSTLARLAIGANNFVMTSNGTSPGWTASTGTGSVARATQPAFNNTIGVGANAAVTGAGVTFPAAQSPSTDPNTLDDYEEGTWTPTVAAGSGTITAYTASGAYTKIGRSVVAYFDVTITNNGTGATSVQVSLPFANNSSMPCVGSGRETTVGNMLQISIGASGTDAGFRRYDGVYPGATGYRLIGTVTYFV